MRSPFHRQHPFFNYRRALLLSIIPVFILGLSCPFYSGPGSYWFNNYLGDVLYQIFLILLIIFIFPQASTRWTSLGVFITSSLIEFLQLWHPPFLQAIRATLLGRLMLGTTFSWEDFLFYAVGGILGWRWVLAVKR